jgi:hypothetical protein
MHTFAVAALAAAGGIALGTVYGRKLEQKIVGTALAEFSQVDAAARDAVSRLHTRLTYLKKYVWIGRKS